MNLCFTKRQFSFAMSRFISLFLGSSDSSLIKLPTLPIVLQKNGLHTAIRFTSRGLDVIQSTSSCRCVISHQSTAILCTLATVANTKPKVAFAFVTYEVARRRVDRSHVKLNSSEVTATSTDAIYDKM